MVHFATEACFQVSVFILVWDWKKTRMFLLDCNTNLFKVSISLSSTAIYFVYKQIKILVDPEDIFSTVWKLGCPLHAQVV